jgi:hypothetical protein
MWRHGINKFATVLSLAVAALLVCSVGKAPAPARAQTSPFAGDLPPAAGGSALLVTTQSVGAGNLVTAIEAGGCNLRIMGVTQGGAWLLYVPGAPDIVNDAFPDPVAAQVPFAIICDPPDDDTQDAVQVIRDYIADLDAGNYGDAYALWEPGRNPQTLEQFEAGYAHTVSVSVEIGTPGHIDAGAGQRYITIPVVIHATLDNGTQQRFEGSYMLHRVAEIPGATPEQQMWHIYSADITQTA